MMISSRFFGLEYTLNSFNFTWTRKSRENTGTHHCQPLGINFSLSRKSRIIWCIVRNGSLEETISTKGRVRKSNLRGWYHMNIYIYIIHIHASLTREKEGRSHWFVVKTTSCSNDPTQRLLGATVPNPIHRCRRLLITLYGGSKSRGCCECLLWVFQQTTRRHIGSCWEQEASTFSRKSPKNFVFYP